MKTKFAEDREYELTQVIRIQYFDSADAKGKLLAYHQGLIFSLARKLVSLFHTESIEDLTQDLSIFLLKCAEKYDPLDERRAKLSTYFRRAVYLNVWKLMKERGPLIAIPKNIRVGFAKVLKIRSEMQKHFQEPIADEQVYEKAGISSELGESFKKIFQAVFISLDSPVGYDDNRTLEGVICKPENQESEILQPIFESEISKIILEALGGTRPIVQVFVQKYLSGMPMEQINDELKLPSDEIERIWRTLRLCLGRNKSLIKAHKSLNLA